MLKVTRIWREFFLSFIFGLIIYSHHWALIRHKLLQVLFLHPLLFLSHPFLLIHVPLWICGLHQLLSDASYGPQELAGTAISSLDELITVTLLGAFIEGKFN